jgi:hypothetical protein
VEEALDFVSWDGENESDRYSSAAFDIWMLHILGVAHRAQSRKLDSQPTEAQEEFASAIRAIIEDFHPSFIAEEDNEQFLAERSEISVSKQIADDKAIEHRFCDPNTKERCAIGYKNFMSIALDLWMVEPDLSNDQLTCKARAIEIALYFPVREQFWLNRLQGCRDANAIFACGDIHIESFGRLLDTEHIPYRIARRRIGVNEKDEPYYRALAYLREHPELLKK